VASMDASQGQPILPFSSAEAWEAWLSEHHAASRGLWIRIAKKATGIASVTHAEALDVALCFGWIDSQRRPDDETFFLQRFTPRAPRSRWSRINRERALALIEEGRMRPPGLRAIEDARRDGRWERAYEPQSAAEVPEDLRRALDEAPAAAAAFATLDSRNRYAVLYRVADAKRPETRARRIRTYVEMLARGERLYP
jgi:uncharacterized protein YdeI (YjbR/CyaY-like superfamily)